MRLTGILSSLRAPQLRCRHRFGFPTSGYVRCLRCTRCYPIQQTPEGEWMIGKSPLPLDPALAPRSGSSRPR